MRFIVEYIDPRLGCIRDDHIFDFDNIAGLCEIIAPGDQHIEQNAIYDLSFDERAAMRHRLGICLDETLAATSEVTLRVVKRYDELPYRIHTNRELFLMLKGVKPLSIFVELLPSQQGLNLIPDQYFSSYVNEGLFCRREYWEQGKAGQVARVVYYAKPSEEWRIDAHILLRASAWKSGWSECAERMEGSLLGYAEWENDAYIEQIYRPGLRR